MSKKKIIVGSIILLVVISIIGMTIVKKNKPQIIEIQTTKVEKQKIVETVTATGRIQPKTQVKISADVAAKIISMDVKEGDVVKKGDFLVQLDRERYLASVESAEANTRSAEANAQVYNENMKKTNKDYARTKSLFDKQLESEVTLDQMYAIAQVEKARYKSALEQVEQAKASLKQANDALSKTTIYAPMSGLGDSAIIEVDALPEKIYKGIITEIANSATVSGQGSANQKTEFEVKINILIPGVELRPGMTASSDIITEVCKNTIGVPIQSVSLKTLEQLEPKQSKSKKDKSASDIKLPEYKLDKEGFVQIVFVVNDNKVIAKEVKTGIQGENNIQILEGISENEEVVTGNFRAISETLRNLTEVVINNEKK